MKLNSTIAAILATAALTFTASANPYETPGQPDYSIESDYENPAGFGGYNDGGNIPPQYAGGFGEQKTAPSEPDSQYNDTHGNADRGASRDY